MASSPRWSVILACAVAACGGGDRSTGAPAVPPPEIRAGDAATSATPRPRTAAEAAALAQAHAWRLGQGAPLDFVAAARAYTELCRAGCGDAEACREYLHLAVRARGAVLARADLATIARLCDRGDATACQVARLVGMRPGGQDPDAVDAACAAGDRQACALAAEFDLEGTRLGIPCEGTCEPSPPSLGHRRPLLACLHGEGRACRSVISAHLDGCRFKLPRTTALDPDACLEGAARTFEVATGTSAQPLRDAWARTRALCAEGDVDACAVVPGRALSDRELCAAGDWQACAYTRDPAEARRACAAGFLDLCEPVGERSLGALRLHELRAACDAVDLGACRDLARATTLTACPPSA